MSISKENQKKILIGAGAVLGAGACIAAAPVIIAGAGFGAGGVVAGSAAAGVQSWIGSVAAGSTFAALQSAGAAGIGTVGMTAAGTAGAGIGAGVAAAAFSAFEAKDGAAADSPDKHGPQSKVNEKYKISLKEAFDRFDRDKDGLITIYQLRSLLKYLKQETSDGTVSDLMTTYSEDKELLGFPKFLELMADKRIKFSCLA